MSRGFTYALADIERCANRIDKAIKVLKSGSESVTDQDAEIKPSRESDSLLGRKWRCQEPAFADRETERTFLSTIFYTIVNCALLYAHI